MKDIIFSVRNELKRNVDAKTKAGSQRFFKEKIKCYGVKSAAVKKIAKECFVLIGTNPGGTVPEKIRVFELAEELFKSNYEEEAWIAASWIYFIREKYQTGDFIIFERWIKKYINDWAKCDTFCNHPVGFFIEKYPDYLEKLKGWARSENKWLRRAAAVSLIIPAKNGKFLKEIFEIADILLLDKEDLVQKGYGWMLKEASRKHQKEVFEYVYQHRKEMPRTALRYAIEKMPENLRKRAMGR